MNTQFIKLVLQNDELENQFYAFYQGMPEYQQANRAYDTVLSQVKEKMGNEFFDQLENHIIAHYLFGLGLRQEILSAFLEIECLQGPPQATPAFFTVPSSKSKCPRSLF